MQVGCSWVAGVLGGSVWTISSGKKKYEKDQILSMKWGGRVEREME